MALTSEQKLNCLQCSDKTYNVFVDDVMDTMISFLNATTCITWIRAYENGNRPEGMYGVLYLVQSERINTSRGDFDADAPMNDNNDGNIGCYLIESEKQYTFTLEVYKENGEDNRNQINKIDAELNAGGFDVLERVIDAFEMQRIRQLLSTLNFKMVDFGAIQWNGDLVNGTWENWCEMNLTMRVCSAASIAAENIKCVELNICGDKSIVCEDDECQ